MEVVPIRTDAIAVGDDACATLDRFLPALQERSVVAITSKIVSICEGSVVKNDGTVDKQELIRQEADASLDAPLSRTYGVTITIKDHKLVANAGIDESNGNGYFVLWPRDPFRSAATIWGHLRKEHSLSHLGILITDSYVVPLQWGTRGRALAWCGFAPLKNYIGTSDIFGRTLRMTKASVVDGLAAAAVAVMGEGNEQTPLAVIYDVPFVTFVDRPPTDGEIRDLAIAPDDDIYAPLLTSLRWKTRAPR